MKFISNSLNETKKIAEDFASKLVPKGDDALVVGLYGNLGAGKTSFTQLLAKHFGVIENVTSPTFVIEKIYPIRTNSRRRPTSNGASEFNHLIHIDAYRIDFDKELINLGWEKIISDKNNLILIEWPERVEKIMPEHIKVRFETLPGDSSREIEILD